MEKEQYIGSLTQQFPMVENFNPDEVRKLFDTLQSFFRNQRLENIEMVTSSFLRSDPKGFLCISDIADMEIYCSPKSCLIRYSFEKSSNDVCELFIFKEKGNGFTVK